MQQWTSFTCLLHQAGQGREGRSWSLDGQTFGTQACLNILHWKRKIQVFLNIVDIFWCSWIVLCLPNSCFRSGNSLGRVSMIDGCLSHIISKCLVNLISDTMFWGLPHQGPWGPGILRWVGFRLRLIFTLHPHSTTHPPQYLHCNPQCPTSDGQTHLKGYQAILTSTFATHYKSSLSYLFINSTA